MTDSPAIPPLSRASLDRDHASRMREGSLEQALADASTRVVLVDGDRTLVADGAIVRVPVDRVPHGARFAWLGRSAGHLDQQQGAVVLAATVDGAVVDGAGDGRELGDWRSLREVGAELDDEDAGILTQAVALARWQSQTAFSGVDGSPVAFEQGGWVGVDAAGAQHFPRMDPAVIVLVTDATDDRILLGRNAAWTDRFSLFAGFVDLGESFEATVVREVAEESGVTVEDPTYVASQPWPFPRSIMVGFEAVALDPEAARPDGEEIVEVRWLTRDDVRNGVVGLPGNASIAAYLIQRWLDR
ncbi:NAD(+) diphosphatase [Agrococcus jejuensis]|uniref:NAD(+) diphosphatase n=1 Tax=Agrococcus jejuensis TaxID=399736 RepID=A0A1G8G977_9MICO|nr:NAD(+) diphosphatase [Agrococcus jejuensis]SDH90913.1 NAD+ diphosphatase [Agrococcus jejuensis]